MDPIVASIVVILGKYALDKGAELAKEAGPTAKEYAGKLFDIALKRLRRTPKGEFVADNFEASPDTYAKPLESELAELAQADAQFAAQLEELAAQYDAAAANYAAQAGTTFTAILQGGGAIAQGEGANAIGERGVYVGGNVSGNIITGSGNSVASRATDSSDPKAELSPPLDNLRQKISDRFNLEELQNLCQDMGIVYEDLAGAGRAGKVRELIAYCQRHGRIDTLLAECRRRRPNVDWPNIDW